MNIRIVSECEWCKDSLESKRGQTEGSENNEFTSTLCLTCLKNADPQMFKELVEILHE